jgi:hypothetical protein
VCLILQHPTYFCTWSYRCVFLVCVQFPCPAGTFGSTPGLTSSDCSGNCTLGYECPPGSTSASQAVCPRGYYCAGGPRQACPRGRFSDVTGTTSNDNCTACAPGRFSSEVAATSASTCVTCGPGEDSSAGAAQCWPGLLSAVAFNPPPLIVGFSVGDIVVLTFSSPTNAPPVTPTLVTFSPPIGATVPTWRRGGRELVVRIQDASGVVPTAVDVASRLLVVTVSGIQSAGGGSPPSAPITLVVGGTWGAPSPPALVSAIATDDGRNVGLDSGDTLLLVFDQPTSAPAALNTVAVGRLLAFSPPLHALGSVSGVWVNTSALLLTLTFGTPASSRPWLPWNVGSLTVTILPSGNLTSANRESAASNASAVVTLGSWGDAPIAQLAEASATTATVTLSPPVSAVGYGTSVYVVQWSIEEDFGALPSLMEISIDTVVTMWALGAQTVEELASAAGAVAGSVYHLPGTHNGTGTAVAVLSPLSVLQAPSVIVELGSLTPAERIFVRAACNGPYGALGPAVPTSPVSVVPQPPMVTWVTLAGSVLGTGGGNLVTIVGVHVGDRGTAVTLLLYNGVHGPFQSTSCSVVIPSLEVQCEAPVGVGAGHAVTLSVDGVPSAPFVNTTLSYAPPVILGLAVVRPVSLEGAGDVVGTSGGSTVIITGVSFGPKTLGPRTLGAVSYTSGATRAAADGVVFIARECTITTDHVEITCVLAPGVGASLQFAVTIAGQSSVVPRTSYHAPVLTSIGLWTPGSSSVNGSSVNGSESALSSLDTQGGQVLAFIGNFFGPPAGATPIQATGLRRGDYPAGSGSVTTTACTVQGAGHTLVHCVTPPGVGVGYQWMLTIAGQASGLSVQTTSYGLPTITSTVVSGPGSFPDEPHRAPTAGGATVTLTGTNFGDDPSTIALTWNGVPVSGLVLTATHTQLTFTSTSGQGPDVALVLSVGGQSIVLGPADGDQLQALSYGKPRVTRVALDRAATAVLLDCSAVKGDGSPTKSSPGSAALVLTGANFGNGSGLAVTVQGVPCSLLPSTSPHTRIVCVTQLCKGECRLAAMQSRLSISFTPPMLCSSSGALSVSVSGVGAAAATLYDFGSLVQPPTVDSVTPLVGPTAGGTLVTVQGTLFGGDATVQFVERTASGALTGNFTECEWRSGGIPTLMCNDTVVRWVHMKCSPFAL